MGVNDGADYGGGFYWAGGGTGTNDKSPSTMGMVFPTPSSYFGVQLVCGKSTCTQPAQIAVGAFSLYVRETSGPGFNAPSGLWQTGGWIRGTWPVVASADSPSGVCSLSRDAQRPADRHEHVGPERLHLASVRGAPAINQPVDTSRYGQGPLTLALGATDAAGVPASISKTVYVDNSTPTVTLSGPVDAPSTAGTQYVTATAGGSPSGIANIVCTVDGGPAQTFTGASAQVPVSGIGPHSVSCVTNDNAVDPSGAHGQSPAATWSLKIGQPTELGIAFDKLVGLSCHRARVRVTIRGHWITVRRHGKLVKVRTHARTKIKRVMRCHPRTVLRRTVVWVRVRRHGHIVKVKRVRRVRVVMQPHVSGPDRAGGSVRARHDGRRLARHVGRNRARRASGAGLTAPDNGSGAFTQAATVTTSATGVWQAKLPPGPSRIVEAVYNGSPTTESSSSGQVKVLVPARVKIAIHPRIAPWGASIRIVGRVLGGYVPANSKLLRLNVGIGRIGHIEGLPDIQPNGRFVIVWKFDQGHGILHPWFSVATLPEAAFPYAPGTSGQATMTLGEPTPRAPWSSTNGTIDGRNTGGSGDRAPPWRGAAS